MKTQDGRGGARVVIFVLTKTIHESRIMDVQPFRFTAVLAALRTLHFNNPDEVHRPRRLIVQRMIYERCSIVSNGHSATDYQKLAKHAGEDTIS